LTEKQWESLENYQARWDRIAGNGKLLLGRGSLQVQWTRSGLYGTGMYKVLS